MPSSLIDTRSLRIPGNEVNSAPAPSQMRSDHQEQLAAVVVGVSDVHFAGTTGCAHGRHFVVLTINPEAGQNRPINSL